MIMLFGTDQGPSFAKLLTYLIEEEKNLKHSVASVLYYGRNVHIQDVPLSTNAYTFKKNMLTCPF